MLACTRAGYSPAIKVGLLTVNPFAGLPQLVHQVAWNRVLSDNEISTIWRATEAIENPHRAYVRVLFLTLQRRTEPACAERRELDLAAGTWTVPAARAKKKQQHVVHLSDGAKAELASLPRRSHGRLVFSLAGDKRLTAISLIKQRIDAEIDVEIAAADPQDEGARERDQPWTLHDFRRRGVNALANMGFAPHICQGLLNHITSAIQGVAAVYQRAEFLIERKAALDAWAKFILDAAEQRKAAPKVVPMQSAV